MDSDKELILKNSLDINKIKEQLNDLYYPKQTFHIDIDNLSTTEKQLIKELKHCK